MLERLLHTLGKSLPVKSILLVTALNYSPPFISSSYAQQTILPAGWSTPAYDPATGNFCTTADQGRKCYADANDAVSYFQGRERLVQAAPSLPAPSEQRELLPAAESPMPDYLPKWKQQKEWNAQLWREQEQKKAEPEHSSAGCGTTCTIIGGLVAVVSGALLISVLQLDAETRDRENTYETVVQEDKKPTGPIVLGIATAAGLGLMLYGIATTK